MVLLLFVFFVELKLMVFILFVLFVLIVLLEFVVGMDEIFDVVIWVVNGVNVDSGEKFLFRGLFFMCFVVVCGFVG